MTLIKKGSKIYSGTTCYTVQSVLGQGSYGKVVKCLRSDNCQTVALKLIDNNCLDNRETAEAEAFILGKLEQLDVPQANWVKLDNNFQYNDYICLEYELLDTSLQDQLPQEDTKHFDLPAVRAVVQQVATALYHFNAAGVIHADLKLDNVMLVNQESQPYGVKVIDFGLAHHVSEAKAGMKFGTLPYMAPELLLGTPYDAAVDVWSLGCMAASLFTGGMELFPGWDDYEMLWCIERSLGKLPQHLISPGKRSKRYFTRARGASSSTWKLKTPRQYYRKRAGIREACRNVSSLDNFLNVTLTGPPIELTAMAVHMWLFKDLLKGMLELDPAHRLTPTQILQHPFITMDNELLQDNGSDYVRFCHQRMAACCQETKPPAAETSPPSVQELRERPASPSSRADPPPPAGTGRKAAAGVPGRRGGDARRRRSRSPERNRDRSRSARDRRKRRSPERNRDRSRSARDRRKRRSPERNRDRSRSARDRRKRRSPERNRDRSRSARDRRAPSQRQPAQRANEGSPPCVCCGDTSRSAGDRRSSPQRTVTPRQPGRARRRPRPSPDRCASSTRRRSPECNRSRSRSPADRRAPSQRQPTHRVNEGSPPCGDSSLSAGNRRSSSQRTVTPRQPGRARRRPRPSPDRCASSMRRQAPERNRSRSPADRRAPSQRQPTQRANAGSPKCSPHRRRIPKAEGSS